MCVGKTVINYKDLIVWQKAHALAIKTLGFVDTLPKSWAAEIIGKQLVSAVTSIGANIAEGYGRGSRRGYMQYFRVARGSANETDNWLNLPKDTNLGDQTVLDELSSICEEILKILTKMTKA